MPIDSICPGCGRTLRVADEHAGTEAQCPVCNAIYRVPASSPSQPDSGLLPQPASRSPSNYAFGEIPGGVSSVVQYPIPSQGTLVLILGGVSWLLCICWVGSMVVSIVALSIGYKDLINIARGDTSPRDRNRTLIGMGMAGIALMINALIVVLMILASLNP